MNAAMTCQLPFQIAEEQEERLAELKADLADRLVLNRQRIEEEHAALMQAQAQVHMAFLHVLPCSLSRCLPCQNICTTSCHFFRFLRGVVLTGHGNFPMSSDLLRRCEQRFICQSLCCLAHVQFYAHVHIFFQQQQ